MKTKTIKIPKEKHFKFLHDFKIIEFITSDNKIYYFKLKLIYKIKLFWGLIKFNVSKYLCDGYYEDYKFNNKIDIQHHIIQKYKNYQKPKTDNFISLITKTKTKIIIEVNNFVDNNKILIADDLDETNSEIIDIPEYWNIKPEKHNIIQYYFNNEYLELI